MPKRILALLTLLTVLLLAVPPAPARADIAPPPIPSVGGLGALEYQSTQVEMRSERVEMEFSAHPSEYSEGSSFYHREVTINAWFVMRNTGSQDETMQVAFPLSDLNRGCSGPSLSPFASYTMLDFQPGSFKAQVNGKAVETTALTTEIPYNNEARNCGEAHKVDWAAFNVTFPVNEDVLVRVSYLIASDGGGDEIFNVGYTLETGAGWKGSIGEAIIVFRFPEVVQNFIMPGTTPGYQVMQNEIYWRYNNLEPGSKDNINIGFIDPVLFANLREYQRRIKANPRDDAAWALLADSYSGIGHWHGSEVRFKEYIQRAYTAYRDGLQANPDSAALNAGYAYLLYTDCCVRKDYTQDDLKPVEPYVAKAIKADSSNEKALELLSALREEKLGLDITPGPTFTPTVTLTPEPTFTAAVTEKPTETPGSRPTPTYTRRPTITSAPTRTQTATPPLVDTARTSGAASTSGVSNTGTAAATSLPVTATIVSAATTGPGVRSPAQLIIGALLLVGGIGVGAFFLFRTMRRR